MNPICPQFFYTIENNYILLKLVIFSKKQQNIIFCIFPYEIYKFSIQIWGRKAKKKKGHRALQNQ